MEFDWNKLLPELKHLVRLHCDPVTRTIIRYTCKLEYLEPVVSDAEKYTKFQTSNLELAEGAAALGYITVVKDFYNDRCDDIMKYAAQNGSIAILTWLYHKGHIPNLSTWINAAKYGKISVIQWLNRYDTRTYIQLAAIYAAKYNQIDMIRFLIINNNNNIWPDRISDRLSMSGHFDTLRILHNEGCPFSELAYKRMNIYMYDHDIWIWANSHCCAHNSDTCITRKIQITNSPPSVYKPRKLIFIEEDS